MSMNALLNALGHDGRMISYRPEWRALVGSVNAVILLQQLLYWWMKRDRKPFYKFKEACGHPSYRPGDSWCEELGFSRAEFDRAWKQIEEAGFASKAINLERITVYTVHEAVLGKATMSLYGENQEDGGSTPRKATKSLYESQEGSPGKATKSPHVKPQSRFSYKEQRLLPEITPPPPTPPAVEPEPEPALDGGGWFCCARGIRGRPRPGAG
ncbi:MAG: hypothetical protein KDI44_17990 [Thiothrix sp.]|nr:hypothetical protein [Thiothrix sp.]HPQ94277.1 hypothetical protein [Thiolinea sp.]